MRQSELELKAISLELIDRDPEQPRQTFKDEDIKALAESIGAEGLKQLPVVKPHPEVSGRYVIVAGERRIRALRILGWDKAVLIVTNEKGSLYVSSLIENMHRVDLNPIEEALGVKRLREEFKMTWDKIERLTGRSVSMLIMRLKLLDLPQEIQDMTAAGTLPQVSALNLAQYKDTRGDLIRLAYDYIQGREPLELHKAARAASKGRESERENRIRGHLPKTGKGLLRRVLGIQWGCAADTIVLKAFLELPVSERFAALDGLSEDARTRMREGFLGLTKALNEFTQMLEKLRESAPAPPRVPERAPSAPRVEIAAPLPAAATATVPAATRKGAAMKAGVSGPPAVRGKVTGPARHMPEDEERCLIEDATKVLDLLAGSDGWFASERSLGKRDFARTFGVADPRAAEKRTVGALRFVRENWLSPPGGTSSTRQAFILRISRVRHDTGCRQFNAFVKRIESMDSSRDPLDLSSLQ